MEKQIDGVKMCWWEVMGRTEAKRGIFNLSILCLPCHDSLSFNLSHPSSNSPPHFHGDWQSCTRYGCLPSYMQAWPVHMLMALYFRWHYETSPKLVPKLSKESREGNLEKKRREGEKQRAWQVFLLRLQSTLISARGLALMPAPVIYAYVWVYVCVCVGELCVYVYRTPAMTCSDTHFLCHLNPHL